jgi:hypothetical protein
VDEWLNVGSRERPVDGSKWGSEAPRVALVMVHFLFDDSNFRSSHLDDATRINDVMASRKLSGFGSWPIAILILPSQCLTGRTRSTRKSKPHRSSIANMHASKEMMDSPTVS